VVVCLVGDEAEFGGLAVCAEFDHLGCAGEVGAFELDAVSEFIFRVARVACRRLPGRVVGALANPRSQQRPGLVW
jgi:hypothetical protein